MGDEPRDPHSKPEVRAGSDEGQSNELHDDDHDDDPSTVPELMVPNSDEMNDFELPNEESSQETEIHTQLEPLEQEMDFSIEEENVLEPERRVEVKAEAEKQARIIQSLERQLKAQRESIKYVRGDIDQGQSNEDPGIVSQFEMPNFDEMDDFELVNEEVWQRKIIYRRLVALEQGMDDLLEPYRKSQVRKLAKIITDRLTELRNHPGYIEYLKTGNDQALTQDSSTVGIIRGRITLDEMNKLDLRDQIKSQERIIDILNGELAILRILEVEGQNHQRQDLGDATLEQVDCDERLRQLDLVDRDSIAQIDGFRPESQDGSGRKPSNGNL
jgi:hypothetical protein